MPIALPDNCVESLEAALNQVKTEGSQLSFSNHTHFELEAAYLTDRIKFPASWNYEEVFGLVRSCLIKMRQANARSKGEFEAFLNSEGKKTFGGVAKEYTVWTKISAQPAGVNRSTFLMPGGVRVTFYSVLPRNLVVREKARGAYTLADYDFPKGGIYVVARGSFQTNRQATESLFSAIYQLIGWFNIAEHRSTLTYRNGEARPKATLLSGKYFAVFRSGRFVNDSGDWYNPEFREEYWSDSTFSASKIKRHEPYVRAYLAKMRSKSFASRASKAAHMLHEGWQSAERHEQISRSWSALELLLSESDAVSDSQDKIISRASAVAKDRRAALRYLKLVSSYRNRYVHRKSHSGASFYVGDFIDRYVIKLIEFLLHNRMRMKSHGEFISMLDAAAGSSDLKCEILTRRRAIRLLERS